MPNNIGDRMATEALKYVGYPYEYAHAGPDSFDCSGLVHWVVLQVTGDDITRASQGQYLMGTDVAIADLRPGDILCYDTDGPPVDCSHVGIYIGPGQMVNALDVGYGVRVDNPFSAYFAPLFLKAKRFYPYDDGAISHPTGTLNPTFTGSDLAIVASTGSAGTTAATRAHDDNLGTSWYTTGGGIPVAATVQFDLGQVWALKGAKWQFRLDNGADEFDVATSTDGISWTAVGTYECHDPNTWYGQILGRNGRYVRVTFKNPNSQPVLGYLAELQVYGMAIPAPGPGTLDPTYAGSKLTITGGSQSSNSVAVSRAYDNNLGTSWYTNVDYPVDGYFQVDLGALANLKGVKWRFRLIDGADEFDISTSTDGTTWSFGKTMGQAPAGEWRGLGFSRQARYIRFTFKNPASRQQIGYVSEIEVWGTLVTTPPTGTWTHRVVDGALNLRSSASTSASIVATLPEGTRLRVISGPTVAGGYNWYNVEAESYGTGWCVDSFEPITTTPPPSGDWTHKVTSGPLNLRASASTTATVVGTMPNGTRLKVLGGPTVADGNTWYNVQAESIGTGWCVNGFEPI